MDAFKLLKTDHKKVSNLFKQIESASGAGKVQLFSQLKNELDLHAHVEEKFLYPALENKEPSREITLEAYEEHKVVKDLLSELASQSIDDQWDAKFSVLKENVEHHVEEEEGELFDKAEKVLSDEQIERLGVEMEAEKAARSNGTSQSSSSSKGRAKSRNSKSAPKPGVLERLANLVGIGTAASKDPKTVAKKPAKKTTKKSTQKVAGKSAKKTAPKTARKAAVKTATKRGASKSAKRRLATGGKTVASPRKTVKKSASKKK